jgi:arylsulfatase A-like enzyme
MRKVLLLLPALWLFAAACAGEPETVSIRLIDGFESVMVQGSPPASEPERTEWRFDGEGTLPALEEAEDGEEVDEGEATFGWTAINDIEGLEVRDGMLVGTTGALPILLGVRRGELDESDVLYAVEIRMRVSEGTEVGIQFNGVRERDDDWVESRIEQLTDQPRRQLRAELTPGDDFLTYTLREAGATIRISAARNILLVPSDVEGAEFEIESVRIIPLKEHLATVPSGLGWHGLSEVYRETIVSRTPERIVMDVDLPARPWLDLAYGTIEDGPVTFEVTVTAAGTETSLLKRTVTTPDRWSTARLELSEYAGQSVTLSLWLDADDPGMLGYWGSLVVRNSGVMPDNNEVTEDRTALLDGGRKRPRAIILLIIDTMRRDHLESYGYERSTSPTMTKLADEGVRFADNISQASWTKVSIPSILTSLYPSTHGIIDTTDRLPSSVTTIAEVLREAGYATWQTSSVPFSGKLSNLHQGVDVLHERTSIGDLDHSASKTARTYVDRLLEWAGDHSDVPFFAFIHAFDPHSPFEPYAPYDALWGTTDGAAEHERGNGLWEGRMNDLPTKVQMDSTDVDQELYLQHEKDWYDGSIRAADVEVARLMEGLEQLGIADETLIVLMSDHGEEFLEHGYHFHGNNAYGEMMNVPLIMHWPGVLPAGTVVEQTTESVDMMPTLLELAGITPPEAAQGQSLLPLIVDPDGVSDFGAIRRAAFSERVVVPAISFMGLPHDSYSIVLDGWKLIQNENQAEDWPEFELYDHVKDPLNLEDVAEDHPDIVANLATELSTWREYAVSLRPPPDTEAIESLSAEEIARLRSLGYIN